LSEQETIWDLFESLLKEHDWFYELDDANPARFFDGMEEEHTIRDLKHELDNIDKERADLLYRRYSPFLNEDGTAREYWV